MSGPPDNCVVQAYQQGIGERTPIHNLIVWVDSAGFRVAYTCDEGDWCVYSGPLDGLRFATRMDTWSGRWGCADGRVLEYDASAAFEGSFSPDLASLSATERRIHRVGSDEIVFTWDWRARRP